MRKPFLKTSHSLTTYIGSWARTMAAHPVKYQLFTNESYELYIVVLLPFGLSKLSYLKWKWITSMCFTYMNHVFCSSNLWKLYKLQCCLTTTTSINLLGPIYVAKDITWHIIYNIFNFFLSR